MGFPLAPTHSCSGASSGFSLCGPLERRYFWVWIWLGFQRIQDCIVWATWPMPQTRKRNCVDTCNHGPCESLVATNYWPITDTTTIVPNISWQQLWTEIVSKYQTPGAINELHRFWGTPFEVPIDQQLFSTQHHLPWTSNNYSPTIKHWQHVQS